MAYESIPLEAFHETFKFNTGMCCICSLFDPQVTWLDLELSSVALGGKVVKVSDEFFAEAFHLLEVEVSPMANVNLQNAFKTLSTASSQPQRAVWP
jgi:allantoicase